MSMSKVKPGTWAGIISTLLDGNRLKIISQNPVNGEERTINEMELLKYITPKIKVTPIAYVPAPTGNPTDRNGFVTDPGNDVWYIDIAGNALRFERGDQYYLFTQGIPDSTWVINHNLGRRPNVQTYIDDELVICDVEHNTVNQLTLSFTQLLTGYAIMT